MPSVRYGVFAIALGLTIATGAAAEELATCGANPSHRMADLPRVAFRSFWPMEVGCMCWKIFARRDPGSAA